jgi:syntaxin 5
MIDRTAEFRAVVATRRQQQQRGLIHPPPVTMPRTRSEFASAASSIGADIHSTANKLEKLTQLAHSNTLLLFADPTEEINELTYIVKQDITALNKKLADLQAAMRERRSGSKQQASHSTSIVEQLKTRLLESAKEFQDILQTRQENVQLMQSRRDKLDAPSPAGSSSRRDGSCACGASTSGSSTPARPAQTPSIFECGTPLGGTPAPGQAVAPVSFGSAGPSIFECGTPLATFNRMGANGFDADTGISFGSSSGLPNTGLPPAADVVIEIPGQALPLMQTQVLTLPSANSTYLQSRAAAVESVQSTIVELGSIFDQLSVRAGGRHSLVTCACRAREDVARWPYHASDRDPPFTCPSRRCWLRNRARWRSAWMTTWRKRLFKPGRVTRSCKSTTGASPPIEG